MSSNLSATGPWPPANGTAMSAFRSSEADIRWDDPSVLDTAPDLHAEPTTRAMATVIVKGSPSVETAATGSFIIVSGPINVGETVEIDGVLITAVGGAPTQADQFDGSSGDSSVIATNIAQALNEGSVGGWGIVTATSTSSTVNLTANTVGEEGNRISLASTSASIVASDLTLSGGADLNYLSIGGRFLVADTARISGANNFDVSDPGQSIADAINDPSNSFPFVTARWTGVCVYISAVMEGSEGNGIQLHTNSEALSLAQTETSGGSGTPCPQGMSNSEWSIVGVNIYRSDTGERGPYFRVNQVPVQALFYRDRTDVVEVPAEIVRWDGGWIFRGDSPNNKGWRLKTLHSPVVKRPLESQNAVHADSPFDVEVFVDGVRAPVLAVFGPKGEIDLSTEQVWDPTTETFRDPPIPTETSSVTIRYFYQKMPKLVNTLDDRYKVFYRLTTVAVDPTGQSPSGLVETRLDYSPPISPMESEKIDYIWKEAIRRNRWILEQGGERVKLFIRRMNGVPCECHWDPRLQEFSKQPLNNCHRCYGTGWVGGYEGPYDIIIGPDDAERSVVQKTTGRRLQHSYEVWIGPTPMVSHRDFIVKQNGEHYAIGPVRRTQHRGLTLQQTFTIGHLPQSDIRYRVPLSRLQLERLPWPETRITSPEYSGCEDVPPYPVGCEPQATPMTTETEKIPEGREIRGRTPVWQNIMYGGGGTP